MGYEFKKRILMLSYIPIGMSKTFWEYSIKQEGIKNKIVACIYTIGLTPLMPILIFILDFPEMTKS